MDSEKTNTDNNDATSSSKTLPELDQLFHADSDRSSNAPVIVRIVDKMLEHRAPIKIPYSESVYQRRAITTLLKRLKTERTMLENMYKSVVSDGNDARGCVLLPRSLDGRLQIAGKKVFPQVIFANIFRFPNVTKSDLVGKSECSHSFNNKSDWICVNPWHYALVKQTVAEDYELDKGSAGRVQEHHHSGGEFARIVIEETQRMAATPALPNQAAPPLVNLIRMQQPSMFHVRTSASTSVPTSPTNALFVPASGIPRLRNPLPPQPATPVQPTPPVRLPHPVTNVASRLLPRNLSEICNSKINPPSFANPSNNQLLSPLQTLYAQCLDRLPITDSWASAQLHFGLSPLTPAAPCNMRNFDVFIDSKNQLFLGLAEIIPPGAPRRHLARLMYNVESGCVNLNVIDRHGAWLSCPWVDGNTNDDCLYFLPPSNGEKGLFDLERVFGLFVEYLSDGVNQRVWNSLVRLSNVALYFRIGVDPISGDGGLQDDLEYLEMMARRSDWSCSDKVMCDFIRQHYVVLTLEFPFALALAKLVAAVPDVHGYLERKRSDEKEAETSA